MPNQPRCEHCDALITEGPHLPGCATEQESKVNLSNAELRAIEKAEHDAALAATSRSAWRRRYGFGG